jgi:hypothetical protein
LRTWKTKRRQAGAPAPGPADLLAREDDEARRVVGGVLDVLGEDVEAVDLEAASAGAMAPRGRVARLGDLAGRAGGVRRDDRLEAELADDLRHWPSAMTWLARSSAWRASPPSRAISWKRIGRKNSPMMKRPESGSRWCTSATRPATEFSIGIMASAASPFGHGGEGVLEGRATTRS